MFLNLSFLRKICFSNLHIVRRGEDTLNKSQLQIHKVFVSIEYNSFNFVAVFLL